MAEPIFQAKIPPESMMKVLFPDYLVLAPDYLMDLILQIRSNEVPVTKNLGEAVRKFEHL